MREIKTYADITKAANAMKSAREIEQEFKRYFPIVDFARFDQSFNDIFAGDEVQAKQVNTNKAMFDAGFKQSDF